MNACTSKALTTVIFLTDLIISAFTRVCLKWSSLRLYLISWSDDYFDDVELHLTPAAHLY